MKQSIIAFFNFSRVERLGIAIGGIVILLFVLIRCGMLMWVHPPLDTALQARLNVDYLAWKEKEAQSTNADLVAASSPESGAALFAFDPNTLDSAGFIRLGMPARAVHGLLNWRSKGKRFYKPEDLKPLYNLPEDVYARLAPYVTIEDAPEGNSQGFAFRNSFPEIPAIIDLNTADSAMLDRGLPGVGAMLAHKLIERRKTLGGFIKVEQIQEVYKFPDTTFGKMKDKLRINPASVKKMDLNGATLAQMSAHPYVGDKVAKNILLYREGIGHYQSVDQLRQVPLMNEEIYRKIAPYFKVD